MSEMAMRNERREMIGLQCIAEGATVVREAEVGGGRGGRRSWKASRRG